MSSVDNRIVRMQFDSNNFVSGATKTLDLLSKLKSALNFSGAGDSLENTLKTVGSTSLTGLSDSVDTVKNKFSILAQAAAVALGNIATQAINSGAQMVKAFTIEPITQGFSEYELKMNSIQTMMMSTGEPLERVNEKLGELNTYADKTIYSFSDMTSNIGKFTNAGVSLDKSVAAIQGVANVAALSGASATDASHAMYNFGQALSSGSVRLQDWKSIEIANMATVEFKNELIKTALAMGTLVEKEGKYVSTTTDLNGHVSEAFDATSMFNDSLSAQWMTTDVLTETLNRYADETTEIGKKAFKAATQVKTFSQLIDTTKEAIGTGWADTFEIVIGNFEEARDLWTSISDVIGDFVNKQSKARNDMLQTWKDLGGRSNLISGLSNVFKGLSQVMGTIGSAWKEVFPPMTGERLAEITKKFLEFTEKLKLSDEASENLKNTFKGLFSGLDIVKDGAVALFKSFSPIGELLPKVASKILDVSGNFGKYVSGLRESIQETNIFNTVSEGLSKALTTIGNVAKTAFDALKSGFSKLKDGLGNVDIFGKISESFERFKSNLKKNTGGTSIADSISKMFDADKLTSSVSKISEKLGEGLKTLMDFVKDVLNSDALTSLIHAGMFTKFLDSITDFSKGITSPFEMISEVGKGAKKALNSIGETLEDFTSNVDGSALRDIGVAVGLLTVSLYALASLSFGDIGKGLGTIGILLGELVIAIQKLDSIEGGKSLKEVSKTLLRISVAVDVLTVAIRSLADMPMDQIARGIVTIGSLLAELGAFTKFTSGSKFSNFKATALLGLSATIAILSKLAVQLGQIDGEVLINGLASVGIILMLLAAFNITTATSKLGLLKAASFLELAAVVKILSDVATDLGSFPAEVLIRGVAAIGAVLAELAAFNVITSKFKMGVLKAASFVELAAVVKILQGVAEDFGSMKMDALEQGLGAIATVLIEMGAFSALMSNVSGMMKTATSLVVMSGAMVILAESLKQFASLKPQELGVGLAGMAGSLIILGTAAALLNRSGMMTAALAMTVMAASMALLAPALKAMGSIGWEKLGIALAGLAGGLTVLGIAGIALRPAIPVLLSIAAVLGTFGLAVAAVAAVVIAFTASGALSSLTSLFGGISGAVKNALDGIGSFGAGLATLGKQITVSGIIELVKGILESVITLIPDLVSALLDSLTILAKGIIEFAPQAGKALVVVITTLCMVLVAAIPTIADAVMQLVLGIANAFINYGPQIITAFVTILILLMNLIGEYAPQLLDAAVDMIVDLANGLADAIRDNADTILGAIRNILSAAIELILECLAQIASLIPIVGDDISEGLEGVKNDVRRTLAPESMSDIGLEAGKGLGTGFGSSMDFVKEQAGLVGESGKTAIEENSDGTFDIGQLRTTEFGDGLGSMKDFCEQNGIDVTDSALAGILSNSDLYGQAGTDDGSNFATDLGNQAGHANASGTEVTNQALAGIHTNDGGYPTAGDADGANFANGVGGQAGNANTQGAAIAAAGAAGANSQSGSFYTAGDNAGSGFCAGLSAWIGQAQGLGATLGNIAANATAAALQERSPSRRMRKIGNYAGEGLVLGGEDTLNDVGRMGESLGNALLESVEDSLEQIDDSEFRPTITPVVNMGEVQNSLSNIQSLVDSTNLSFNGSADVARLQLQNGSNFNQLADSLNNDNSEVVEELQSLREDIGKLAMAVTSMQIVLDSGVLVGATSAQMDSALQTRQIQAERGM